MNLEAQTALAAGMAAIAAGVADLGKQIAAHPLLQQQPDDSADILKAAEELQGLGSQLEDLAGKLNPAPAGSSSSPAGDTATAPAGDTATAPAVAPEAGSVEGPGTAEPTPEVVAEQPASTDQTATA